MIPDNSILVPVSNLYLECFGLMELEMQFGLGLPHIHFDPGPLYPHPAILTEGIPTCLWKTISVIEQEPMLVPPRLQGLSESGAPIAGPKQI